MPTGWLPFYGGYCSLLSRCTLPPRFIPAHGVDLNIYRPHPIWTCKIRGALTVARLQWKVKESENYCHQSMQSVLCTEVVHKLYNAKMAFLLPSPPHITLYITLVEKRRNAIKLYNIIPTSTRLGGPVHLTRYSSLGQVMVTVLSLSVLSSNKTVHWTQHYIFFTDISGGARAVKEPGHFEVRKSSSQVTRMHFFLQKS